MRILHFAGQENQIEAESPITVQKKGEGLRTAPKEDSRAGGQKRRQIEAAPIRLSCAIQAASLDAGIGLAMR